MKKFNFFLAVFISIVISFSFITNEKAYGQKITIKLTQPPPGKLGVVDLLKTTITNTTEETYRVYFYGTLTEKKAGLIATATTVDIEIKPGIKNMKASDFPTQSDVSYPNSNPKYKEALIKTGNVPPGDYEYCIYAKLKKNNEELGNDCLEQIIEKTGIISLISPNNEEEITPEQPLRFAWMSTNRLKGTLNTFKIVEVTKGQSPEVAMKQNTIFFQKNDLKSPFFIYPSTAPKFSKDKKYAWNIKVGEMESEVWTFNAGTEGKAPPHMCFYWNGQSFGNFQNNVNYPGIPFNQGPDFTNTVYVNSYFPNIPARLADIKIGKWQNFSFSYNCASSHTSPANFCPVGWRNKLSGLVAWFPFDELNENGGPGASCELTQWDNNYNYPNAFADWYGNVTPVPGKVFYGLKFDGSGSSFVQMTDHSGDPLCPDVNFHENKSYSISLWFKLNSNSSTDQIFLDKRTKSGNVYKGYHLLYRKSTNRFILQLANGIGGTTYTNYSSPVSVNLNNTNWYNLVVIVRYFPAGAGVRRIIWFLNNSPKGTNYNARGGDLTNTAPLKIGGHNFESRGFNGIIDELQIYERVLTVIDRSMIYDNQKAGVFGFCKPSGYYYWEF